MGAMLCKTDLTGCDNHYVDDIEDDQPDADTQGHVVQRPSHPTASLRLHLVPDTVSLTGLKMRENIECHK